jgi:hypothetical protein
MQHGRYDGNSNSHPDGVIGCKTLAMGNMEGVLEAMDMPARCHMTRINKK